MMAICCYKPGEMQKSAHFVSHFWVNIQLGPRGRSKELPVFYMIYITHIDSGSSDVNQNLCPLRKEACPDMTAEISTYTR